jgi:hypothetical protein
MPAELGGSGGATLPPKPEKTRTPKVTILVPTIGRVEYLSATRASIAAQTFGDYEVLVLDNASPEAA